MNIQDKLSLVISGVTILAVLVLMCGGTDVLLRF